MTLSARAATRFFALPVRPATRALGFWTPGRWGVALAAAVVSALLLGLPTDLVPNPVFGREIPPTWWSYPVFVASALLAGLLVATYVRTGRPRERATRLGSAGALLSFLAVGCPVCNKLVLLALGTSGALTLWAPLQPALAVASLVLLAVAAVRRLAGETACPAPTAA
ncbi:hypothetical protein H9Y04_41900 [Streptomyces sp. TRM66268-LWL]|uniref:Integral membrane protein n=1 Tax=Streptomyces polyasparticus TaxID=2767826 RepID=A0ABR7SUB5_9ACTN|nr:hypothetical protein [Streptomyces polyasparticus]MBC9719092.1 hypothetical protein [Streptomyces polyasparticus]